MELYPKKSLDNWWDLIRLTQDHVEFLRKHIGVYKDLFILPDGSFRPSFVKISKSTFSPLESVIVDTILLRQYEYKTKYSNNGQFGLFFWKYLTISSENDFILIDISDALGVIWIWDELQKHLKNESNSVLKHN